MKKEHVLGILLFFFGVCCHEDEESKLSGRQKSTGPHQENTYQAPWAARSTPEDTSSHGHGTNAVLARMKRIKAPHLDYYNRAIVETSIWYKPTTFGLNRFFGLQKDSTPGPGRLGKYFVYVNCTNCKVRSGLMIRGDKVRATMSALDDEAADKQNGFMPAVTRWPARQTNYGGGYPNYPPNTKTGRSRVRGSHQAGNAFPDSPGAQGDGTQKKRKIILSVMGKLFVPKENQGQNGASGLQDQAAVGPVPPAGVPQEADAASMAKPMRKGGRVQAIQDANFGSSDSGTDPLQGLEEGGQDAPRKRIIILSVNGKLFVPKENQEQNGASGLQDQAAVGPVPPGSVSQEADAASMVNPIKKGGRARDANFGNYDSGTNPLQGFEGGGQDTPNKRKIFLNVMGKLFVPYENQGQNGASGLQEQAEVMELFPRPQAAQAGLNAGPAGKKGKAQAGPAANVRDYNSGTNSRQGFEGGSGQETPKKRKIFVSVMGKLFVPYENQGKSGASGLQDQAKVVELFPSTSIPQVAKADSVTGPAAIIGGYYSGTNPRQGFEDGAGQVTQKKQKMFLSVMGKLFVPSESQGQGGGPQHQADVVNLFPSTYPPMAAEGGGGNNNHQKRPEAFQQENRRQGGAAERIPPAAGVAGSMNPAQPQLAAATKMVGSGEMQQQDTGHQSKKMFLDIMGRLFLPKNGGLHVSSKYLGSSDGMVDRFPHLKPFPTFPLIKPLPPFPTFPHFKPFPTFPGKAGTGQKPTLAIKCSTPASKGLINKPEPQAGVDNVEETPAADYEGIQGPPAPDDEGIQGTPAPGDVGIQGIKTGKPSVCLQSSCVTVIIPTTHL